jgi:hypothetical protein
MPSRAPRDPFPPGCRRIVATAVALGLLAGPVGAQPAPQEDWPCVQILVPEITPQAIWAGPPLDSVEGDWQTDPDAAPLALKLADSALPLDEAADLVADYAGKVDPGERDRKLTLLFEGTLEILNGRRDGTIAGIKRYARRQQELAQKIAQESRAADAASDPGEAQDLATARDWDLRVFDDRRRMLTQVCDQPVLLEQRAFALARTIQSHLGTN